MDLTGTSRWIYGLFTGLKNDFSVPARRMICYACARSTHAPSPFTDAPVRYTTGRCAL
ncbi:MAG: hypothetical protein WC959_02615 [Kiritimatiellales bacterium]